MEYIIGIDPGVSGGCALLRMDGVVSSMEVFKNKTPIDIYECFPKTSENVAIKCYIEKVHSMPKQGVKSTFTFGQNYGMLLMACYAVKYRVTHVQPLKWQTYLGCRSKGDKNVTKRKAQELFPGLTITHAIADALLIAEYGRRQELLLQRTSTVDDL